MHDLVAKITENMEFWIFLYCGLSVILQRPAPWYGWGYWKSKVRIVIHMAQEYYSFMMNSFFETLFILSYPNKYVILLDWLVCAHDNFFLWIRLLRCRVSLLISKMRLRHCLWRSRPCTPHPPKTFRKYKFLCSAFCEQSSIFSIYSYFYSIYPQRARYINFSQKLLLKTSLSHLPILNIILCT